MRLIESSIAYWPAILVNILDIISAAFSFSFCWASAATLWMWPLASVNASCTDDVAFCVAFFRASVALAHRSRMKYSSL
uniref:Uncharacterized protein n=1 Tax=Rhipicephalus microplus TaxID=6941 RepID=A0A6M2DAX9_RHIMP